MKKIHAQIANKIDVKIRRPMYAKLYSSIINSEANVARTANDASFEIARLKHIIQDSVERETREWNR
jgi:hypothetical protein